MIVKEGCRSIVGSVSHRRIAPWKQEPLRESCSVGLTIHNHRTRLCLSNDIRPKRRQQAESDKRQRSRQHGQTKENHSQRHIIQKEELKVVLQSRHDQRGRFLHIKRPLFSNAKEHRDTAKFLTIEELLGRGRDVILRALRNVGSHTRHRLAGARGIPFFLAGNKRHKDTNSGTMSTTTGTFHTTKAVQSFLLRTTYAVFMTPTNEFNAEAVEAFPRVDILLRIF